MTERLWGDLGQLLNYVISQRGYEETWDHCWITSSVWQYDLGQLLNTSSVWQRGYEETWGWTVQTIIIWCAEHMWNLIKRTKSVSLFKTFCNGAICKRLLRSATKGNVGSRMILHVRYTSCWVIISVPSSAKPGSISTTYKTQTLGISEKVIHDGYFVNFLYMESFITTSRISITKYV